LPSMEVDQERPSQEADRLFSEKQYDKALTLLDGLIKNEKATEWDRFRAGWCIYYTKFKNASGDAVIRIAHEILSLMPKEKRETDLLVQITALKTVDSLKNKNNESGYTRIIELLDLLNPESLNEETGTGFDGKGKQIEYASNKEKYYAEKTRALFELKRWSECIDSCEEALGKIAKFHYGNDIWFKRRRALSLNGLGRHEEALLGLREVLAQKHDWFIESELAIILHELGDHDSAWHHAVNASIGLQSKDAEYGVKLFELMGNILTSMQRPNEAEQHFMLAAAIRNEKGWSIPESLKSLTGSKNATHNKGVQEVLLELRSFWQSEKKSWTKILHGKIKNILNDGACGFIIGDDGNDYYFRTKSFIQMSNGIKNGMEVRFEAIKSYDKKKQKDSLEAIRIMPPSTEKNNSQKSNRNDV